MSETETETGNSRSRTDHAPRRRAEGTETGMRMAE